MSVFAAVRDWVFDLDNTLYPADVAVYKDVGARMTAYIARREGLAPAAALALQERYFHQYGATIVGLVRHHGFDAADFLRDVHDTPLDAIVPNPALTAAIDALPGRKFVFTNGARDYALRILRRLNLEGIVDGLSAIDDRRLAAKPQPAAFHALVAEFGLDPPACAFFDDHRLNLHTAAALGFQCILVGAETPPEGIPFATADLAAFLGTHGVDARAPAA